jgi:hypothetical protein
MTGHHDLPYSPQAAAFVSYYETVFNRACASGAHSDLFDLHDPQGTLTYPGPEHAALTTALADALVGLPKSATLSFVSPRGNAELIIAGFHAHGWPAGDIVGHAIFELTNGRVAHLKLEGIG